MNNDQPAFRANSNGALYIQTFGQFCIYKQNGTVSFRRKNSKRHKLLQVIISLGCFGISIDTLIDIVWPEAEGDKAFHSFEMSLHRLRKDLGVHNTLYLNEGTINIDNNLCSIDVHSFDKLVKDIFSSTANHSMHDNALQLFQVYQGDFLPGLDVTVINSSRGRYRQLFFNAVHYIGINLEKDGQHSNALNIYLQALSYSGVAESLYLGAIRCHLFLDQREEAILCFRTLEVRLKDEYGLKPSTEAVQLIGEATA